MESHTVVCPIRGISAGRPLRVLSVDSYLCVRHFVDILRGHIISEMNFFLNCQIHQYQINNLSSSWDARTCFSFCPSGMLYNNNNNLLLICVVFCMGCVWMNVRFVGICWLDGNEEDWLGVVTAKRCRERASVHFRCHRRRRRWSIQQQHHHFKLYYLISTSDIMPFPFHIMLNDV